MSKSKADAKAERKAHERKKRAAATKDARKFAYIVVGIALIMLVLLYFIFRSRMG